MRPTKIRNVLMHDVIATLAFIHLFKPYDPDYALRESGEAYRGQFDSKNEALTRKHTFMGENYRTCGNLAWSNPGHRSDHSLKTPFRTTLRWP